MSFIQIECCTYNPETNKIERRHIPWIINVTAITKISQISIKPPVTRLNFSDFPLFIDKGVEDTLSYLGLKVPKAS